MSGILYQTPFHKAYWKQAARELSSTRMLVVAAALTAARIAVKSFSIPVGPDLKITFGFLFNAMGSMIYGPVMAVLTSAVSDTAGALLFPSGTYFFPFIFEEIAGGVLFALFYYRARITPGRIMLGRFAVTIVCNLLLTPLLMYAYYQFYMGRSYAIFSLPRMIKNAVLFPLQCLLLIVLFRMLLPYTNKAGLTHTGQTSLKLTRHDVLLLAGLTVLSVLCIVWYVWLR